METWRRRNRIGSVLVWASGGSGKGTIERETFETNPSGNLSIFMCLHSLLHFNISTSMLSICLIYDRLSKLVANGLEYNQSKCKPSKEKDSQEKAIAWFLWLTREDSLSSTSSPFPYSRTLFLLSSFPIQIRQNIPHIYNVIHTIFV